MPFTHPGLDQNAEDLSHLKKQVANGEQPWQSAYEKLKTEVDLDFSVAPVTHVSQGGYGANDRGGKHLSEGSRIARDCALLWYLSDDDVYARKAAEIIGAWSVTLWDFDDNNAKLNAAGAVNNLCKAAEILRYTYPAWSTDEIDAFEKSLITVFYPLLRHYFPDANGNWDGYIIRAILSIGIFTDNQALFDNAIAHFLYAPINGSLFKYVYPSGQCQESTRDHGHIQMGLGAFANVAQIAFTQGVDLFSLGDNRLAAGIEYESAVLLGDPVFCYGKMTERAPGFKDSSLNYVYVRDHYARLGVELPGVERVLATELEPSAWNVLTAVRVPNAHDAETKGPLKVSETAFPAGAQGAADTIADAIVVRPGESIQAALDSVSEGGCVLVSAGTHTLPNTLRVPSDVILSGEGIESVLWLDPESDDSDAMVAATPDLHDVTIRDLVIDGAVVAFDDFSNQRHRAFHNRSQRGGIVLHGDREGQARNLRIENVTVKNCTRNGLFVAGARNVRVLACDLDENGARVVPGPGLQHNLLLRHCSDVRVENTRADGSFWGSGIVVDACSDVTVSACEIARNADYGVRITECDGVTVTGCLVEGGDTSGILIEHLYSCCRDITVSDNRIQYNNGYGVESYAVENLILDTNSLTGNAAKDGQEHIADRPTLILGE